jgi:hypothetical protein
MKIIGISGFKRSGKDSTYEAIRDLLPHSNVRRVGFADKLKELGGGAFGYREIAIEKMDEAKERWNIALYDEEDDPRALKIVSGRAYLQNLGVVARELFGENFWIDSVLPWPNGTNVALMYPDTNILCITDVRYSNEAFRILQLGGDVWEINRPGTASDGHSSEIPLPRNMITHIISNDGTLNDLKEKVKEIL